MTYRSQSPPRWRSRFSARRPTSRPGSDLDAETVGRARPTSWSASQSPHAREGYTVTAVVRRSRRVGRPLLRGNGEPIHTLDNAFYKAYSAASLTLARRRTARRLSPTDARIRRARCRRRRCRT